MVPAFQKFVQSTFGIAVPLFTGRSIFFKSLGIMPRRRPVVVVVGKPIPPPTPQELKLGSKIDNDDDQEFRFSPKIDRKTGKPLNDHGRLLIEWHARYVKALEELYHEYKDARWNPPGNNRRQSMAIVR